jgi:hypothetical protein
MRTYRTVTLYELEQGPAAEHQGRHRQQLRGGPAQGLLPGQGLRVRGKARLARSQAVALRTESERQGLRADEAAGGPGGAPQPARDPGQVQRVPDHPGRAQKGQERAAQGGGGTRGSAASARQQLAHNREVPAGNTAAQSPGPGRPCGPERPGQSGQEQDHSAPERDSPDQARDQAAGPINSVELKGHSPGAGPAPGGLPVQQALQPAAAPEEGQALAALQQLRAALPLPQPGGQVQGHRRQGEGVRGAGVPALAQEAGLLEKLRVQAEGHHDDRGGDRAAGEAAAVAQILTVFILCKITSRHRATAL